MTSRFEHVQGAASAAPGFEPSLGTRSVYELSEDERITGCVKRLPAHGVFNGTRLFIQLDDGRIIGVHATASQGHTVLARSLDELEVQLGDHLEIHYRGRRRTADGEREYRDYVVRRL